MTPVPAVPPLHVRAQPGLTETLDGPRDPRQCQGCGARYSAASPLMRWLEHDEWDQVPKRPAVVVLCNRCSAQRIEAHARLYRALGSAEPFPGCMRVCLSCPSRQGVACASPVAQLNGGSGLVFAWKDEARPTRMHVYCSGRRGYSGWRTEWPGRVLDCSGRPMIADQQP